MAIKFNLQRKMDCRCGGQGGRRGVCEKLRSTRFLRRAVRLDRRRSSGGSKIYSGEVTTARVRIPSCFSLLLEKEEKVDVNDKFDHSKETRNFVDASQEHNLTIQE
ncbi:unnamed protein product, partial [Vitis vinifera]